MRFILTFDNKKDPFREREAAEYEHPVASREWIIQYLAAEGKPVSWQHLCEALEIKTDEEIEGLHRRLKAMVRDGQLMTNRRGSYALVQQLDLVPGRVQGHREGFGFLIPDDGSEDVFLPPGEMAAVFNDDRVLVRVIGTDRKGRREGQIAEILEHNTSQVVGKFIEEEGINFVDPDNKLIIQNILIPENQRGEAKPGQFVVVDIIAQPTKRRQPLGKVVEILGDQFTPGMEVELSIRAYNLSFVWPEEVLKEANQFRDAVTLDQGAQRRDLRQLSFVTIDGEDAKDFDDAVYCQRLENKKMPWKLYVAIADVDHYVRPGTALDTEAEKRGNSVYFPNKVLPMLPEELSNGLCSLKPNVDRLVMVCEMDIDAEGLVKKYQFYEGVIHSQARLTYSQVAQVLEGDLSLSPELTYQMKIFHELFLSLLKQREIRGAIEFDTTETRILFGAQRKIDRIVPVQRNDAHKMIEEAMLVANVCAAHFLQKGKISTLYRVHDGPDPQRLLSLNSFLKAFGLRLGGGNNPTPKAYNTLVKRIADRPDFHLLQTVLLRSLRQAVYSPENIGHFGLAYDAYTHFTSPIRRFPDLIVHRGIKHLLKQNDAEFSYSEKAMVAIGDHCSMTERRADLATRDAVDWLKCEYIQHKLGQVFPGIISDVTSFGVFVELNDIYVQGLLHITSLVNDYYQYDATNHILRGRHSGIQYQLGDTIEVLVARVDLDKRTIDFELPSYIQEKQGLIKQKNRKKSRKRARVNKKRRKQKQLNKAKNQKGGGKS